jgi:hypothetical protein
MCTKVWSRAKLLKLKGSKCGFGACKRERSEGGNRDVIYNGSNAAIEGQADTTTTETGFSWYIILKFHSGNLDQDRQGVEDVCFG